MIDVVDQATRRKMMQGIRAKNTAPEVKVRKALFAVGMRFRIQATHLPGSPDIVLPKHGVAVFVHGCFWHRHGGCAYSTTPATRPDFWEEKFAKNQARDARAIRALVQLGWRVLVIWECSVRKSRPEQIADAVSQWIAEGDVTGEVGLLDS